MESQTQKNQNNFTYGKIYHLLPTAGSKSIHANNQFILRQLQRGFRPKWYCVFHLNSSARHDDEMLFDKDLSHVRNMLYSEMYGKNWKRVKNKARAIWCLEFGKHHDRPHINLLIEALPYPYDSFRSAFALFDRLLPRDARCVWRKSAHLQPIDLDDATSLYQYIVKESNWCNQTINYQITDVIT
jgi:hypothetical protein